MKENKKLAQSSAVQIVGKMLAVVLGALTVVVLAQHLSLEGYGQLTIILGFLSIFAVIVDFGLTLTTVQMISEDGDREETLLGNLLAIRLISASTFLALAPVIALFFPYDTVVQVGIAVGAASYLFSSTSHMLVGVFQKRLEMGGVVMAELANRVLVFAGAILAPVLGFGLIGIVWLLVIGNALQLGTTVALARRYVRLRPAFNLHVWRDIFLRSWPIGLSIFFNLIYLRGDILFLSLYRDEAEIGVYGVAYKVLDVVTVIPVMYMGLILPMLVAAWSQKSAQDFRQNLQNTFDFFSYTALPFAAGSVLLGAEVVELIFNEEQVEGASVLAILGPAASVVFFGSLFGHAIVGINKQKQMVLGYLAVAVVTIAGYLIFIPEHGIYAAAWWTLIAEVLITLLTFVVVWRVSGFFPRLAPFCRAAFATLVMGITLTLLPNMHVLLAIAIGCATYLIALTAIGGPNIKDATKLFLPEKPTGL